MLDPFVHPPIPPANLYLRFIYLCIHFPSLHSMDNAHASGHRFLMKKVVVGHDRAYLERQITQCIRSTGYLFNVSVKFPIHDKQVEVCPANRISKLRGTEWFRWIFYITFLWIFAWPYLWFMTKRYHVATMTWRMSRPVRDESGETRREYVQTEEEWMHCWEPAIKRAVTARGMGSVSQWDRV
ncbi:hypothetical protein HOY80DRAFT_359769 [Tuber brumale]|nr:hypothetical protein HOY80DRAFT_359769 [Tuber brumale]